MSRIGDAFERAAAENRAAFVPYLTAAYPNEARFIDQAGRLLAVADVLEVGLPYSDPLGDGPTIQRSSEAALAQGVTIAKVFELLAHLRATSDKALAVMTYYNPVYRYPGGEGRFLEDVQAAGADGVILPDLPPDEGPGLIDAARALDLDTIFLVAPTSTDARLRTVTAACRGFVYAVSVTGVTGARTRLPSEVPDLVARTKKVTSLPVAVGFGVSNAATAHQVAQVADGVVVGSALIKALDSEGNLEPLAVELAHACRR